MNKKLVSHVLDFYITTACTLNCKLCMTGVPFIPNKHISVDSLEKQLEKYFQIWDYSERLEFMGGEPLMHPDLCEIVRMSLKFRGKYDRMRVTTNGTIVPKDEFFELLANCGKFFDFVVDNYGPLSKNLKALTDRLDFYHLPYRIDRYTGDTQHFNGWVDLGDCEYIGYPEEGLSKIYYGCVSTENGFVVVHEGKVFECPYHLRLFLRKGILPAENEYIDLFDDAKPLAEKREIAERFYTTPISVCNYCLGFYEKTSKRFPAAEQAERTESA